MTASVRHVLPGFGYFPDAATESPMSGIAYVAFQLARQAARAGWEPSLLTYSNGADRPRFDADGVAVRRVRHRPALGHGPVNLSYLGPLAMAGWRDRVDVAHIHSNPYHLPAVRAGRRVVHYHTRDFKALPAYRRALRRADALVFCSAALQRLFAEALGDVPTPQFVVHNGTDLERFRGQEAAGQEFRRRLGIGPAETVVLFAGTIHPEKGLHVLIEAIHRARHLTAQPLRLVVVGSSTIWHQIGQPVAVSDYERGLVAAADPALVSFVGALPQSAMPTAYAACDFSCCPSVYPEPFPVVNVEVMAAGRPVVGSRAGGIPELVADDVTGVLVEPADAPALAAAIAALADDAPRRRRLGEGANRRVQTLTWDRIALRMTEIYGAIGGPPVAASPSTSAPSQVAAGAARSIG